MNDNQYDIPIALFIFNRLDTLERVFEKVRSVRPQKLYLISDCARKDKEGEEQKVGKVRKYVESNIDWVCQVQKNYATTNMGCKMRMSSGISWFFENEEMGIFLEDDILVSDSFFPYMREMLLRYKDDERIGIVSGFKQVPDYPIRESYFFSQFPSIWGWGSFRRAWKFYNVDIPDWPVDKKDKILKPVYTAKGYATACKRLDKIYYDHFDTWDFQWDYIRAKHHMLGIVPQNNLVVNIGFGPEATHTKSVSAKEVGIMCELNDYDVVNENVAVIPEYEKIYIERYCTEEYWKTKLKRKGKEVKQKVIKILVKIWHFVKGQAD